VNENDFAELSAGFALGALSPDDERAFRAALADHPEWQGIAALDAETVSALAEGVPAVSPPLELRSKLLSAIAASDAPAATPQAATEPDAASSPAETGPLSTELVQTVQRRNWSRGLFALVASIALLVGIGWGVGAVSTLWQTPASTTALEQIEQAPDASSADTTFDGGSATVHWSESVGKVVLVADGLPPIEADQTYELWYVRGGSAITAGTFAAENGASTAQLTGTMRPGDTVAVTVEQAGGSPTGSPTTDPLFAVSTA
jgi:anti-sigma-K factor RskA